MINEFFFLVLKINIVTNRIDVLNKDVDFSVGLNAKELSSLESFRKDLIERSIEIMSGVPIAELTKSFFENNDKLLKDSVYKEENAITFTKLTSFTIAALSE